MPVASTPVRKRPSLARSRAWKRSSIAWSVRIMASIYTDVDALSSGSHRPEVLPFPNREPWEHVAPRSHPPGQVSRTSPARDATQDAGIVGPHTLFASAPAGTRRAPPALSHDPRIGRVDTLHPARPLHGTPEPDRGAAF